MEKPEKRKSKVVLKRRFISDVVEVEEKPPPKPPKVHDSGVSEEVLSQLSDAFSLMYDPNFLGHLPLDEQLTHFKKRDLLETKLYKTALKAFGSQQFVREKLAKDNGRKRVFVAQPLSELRGFDSFSAPPSSLPRIQSKQTLDDYAFTNGNTSSATNSDESNSEMAQYRSWLQKRQKQHRDLERMGDVERYLKGKGDLSSAERHALNKINDSKRPKEVEVAKVEETETRTRPTERVEVKRPSPLALFIIDSELKKRKLRLSDLFASIDRDKNWQLSRDEFRNAIRKSQMPLPEPLLEDMIITLDQDNNNQLDYRELAQGLEQFRRERRSPEFLSLLSEQSNQFLLASSASMHSMDEEEQQQQQQDAERSHSTPLDTIAEALPAHISRNSTSNSLQPGQFDVSQERFSVDNAEQSVDVRKRDQIALSRFRPGRQPPKRSSKTMIKTFDREVDDHMSLSTLPERELADMVDDYRQQQLREYSSIVAACKQRGVVFSEKLYKRVLLHPADKPHRLIRRHVRPPGQKSDLPLEALYGAGSGAGSRPGGGGDAGGGNLPQFGADSRRGGRGRPVVNLARAGADLPTVADLRVDDDDAEQELVTGTAMIRPKVDCWLTFEDFERLSANVDYSKQSSLRRPRSDAFWPGRLEQRVRVFLDSNDDTVHGAGVMFQSTEGSCRPKRTHPFHARQNWPVNNGHVTYGSIDPMLRHQVMRVGNISAG